MREIRTSGSMRGRRKRAVACRACVLLYRAPNSPKALFQIGFGHGVDSCRPAFDTPESSDIHIQFLRLHVYAMPLNQQPVSYTYTPSLI